jgi:hypothetical protein
LRSEGWERPLIVDPDIYFDPRSQLSLFRPFEQDTAIQAQLGVSFFVSPSSAVPRDDGALRAIFASGRTFSDEAARSGHHAAAFTTVVLSSYWLGKRLPRLVAMIAEHPLPLAFVPGSPFDLFATQEHVEALLACIRAATGEVALLRCDLSGIGAVANGAALAAIGSSTAVRHLFLPMKKSKTPKTKRGDGADGRGCALLVPALVSYQFAAELAYIPPNDPVQQCPCSVCGGRSLDRFNQPGLVAEADLHSVVAWHDLVDKVMHGQPSAAVAWKKVCGHAVDEFDALEGRTGRLLNQPGFLTAWRKAG